ncbi:MAG: hypothetical protein ACREOZ_01450 [Gloeomargaritales cyanobacterium]
MEPRIGDTLNKKEALLTLRSMFYCDERSNVEQPPNSPIMRIIHDHGTVANYAPYHRVVKKSIFETIREAVANMNTSQSRRRSVDLPEVTSVKGISRIDSKITSALSAKGKKSTLNCGKEEEKLSIRSTMSTESNFTP